MLKSKTRVNFPGRPSTKFASSIIRFIPLQVVAWLTPTGMPSAIFLRDGNQMRKDQNWEVLSCADDRGWRGGGRFGSRRRIGDLAETGKEGAQMAISRTLQKYTSGWRRGLQGMDKSTREMKSLRILESNCL